MWTCHAGLRVRVFRHDQCVHETLRFQTRSGELRVRRDAGRLVLDFPARPATPCAALEELARALGADPTEVYRAEDYLVVLASEVDVRALQPDFALVREIECRGIIVTAPGRDCDFVSRFFAPRVGILEDPATGSSHCTLTPYWSRRLDKAKLRARQVSARGGEFWCEDRGERVLIAGHAALVMEGTLILPR